VEGRKRVEIIASAEEKGIHVLNPRRLREPEAVEEGEETEETEKLSKGEK
jgi:hypothetical protein